MYFDPCQSRDFLKLLDPNAAKFTFQTLGEGDAKRDERLCRVLHGRFDDVRPELQELNSRGAGVFVTVNETDGKGRKSGNITKIRAIWHEDDHGIQGEFPLEPSIVVESSFGKFHRYWLANSDADLMKTFPLVMQTMVAEYGSDSNAKDVSRVLRLPGFFHMKDNPVLVRLVTGGGRRYSLDEITAAFPPMEACRRNSCAA